jgi:hypothetical protein
MTPFVELAYVSLGNGQDTSLPLTCSTRSPSRSEGRASRETVAVDTVTDFSSTPGIADIATMHKLLEAGAHVATSPQGALAERHGEVCCDDDRKNFSDPLPRGSTR